MNSAQGWILLSLVSVLLAWIIAAYDMPVAAFIPASIAGIGLLFFIILEPEFGFYFALIFSFLSSFVLFILLKAYSVRPGILIDSAVWLTAFSLIIYRARSRTKSWLFFNSPAAIGMVAYFLFFTVEALNPEKASVLGWAMDFRRELSIFLLFFISLEIFRDLNFFRRFVNIWLVLATVTAAYGCYQQFVGFLPSEKEFIYSTRETYLLIFVDGHFRKFSIYPDPTSFGIFMGFSSVFFLSLLSGPFGLYRKILYATCSVIMIMGMLFSGTRTAYAMIPLGFLIFCIMTLNRRESIYVIILGVLTLVLVLFLPVHNEIIDRVRSLFLGSSDPSLNVRNVNRKHIQPFMHAHPIGSGIATVGTKGMEYNPEGPLAGFPPDSELLSKALEIGYIGLAVFMLKILLPMLAGVRGYFSARNPEIKAYLISLVSVFFSIMLSLYSQEISLYTSLFVVILSAFIVKMIWFDDDISVSG